MMVMLMMEIMAIGQLNSPLENKLSNNWSLFLNNDYQKTNYLSIVGFQTIKIQAADRNLPNLEYR